MDIVLSIDGQNVRESGKFKARRKEDIPYWAKRWIGEIKLNHGFRRIEIVSIMLDGEEDITEKVLKLFI